MVEQENKNVSFLQLQLTTFIFSPKISHSNWTEWSTIILTSFACTFCFPISDHVMLLWRTVSFKDLVLSTELIM